MMTMTLTIVFTVVLMVTVKTIVANESSILFYRFFLKATYQYKAPLPFVLCSEAAGVISEVGSEVKNWKVGDKVFFSTLTHGAAQEEAVLDQSQLLPLPECLSFSQGASFLMGYTTAYHALVHRGRLQPGEWLLVTGAAGGMGVAALQMGKALGAKVIAAASSDEKLSACKALGVDATINYAKQDLKKACDEITGGDLCDVIYEPVGGEIFDKCVRCVATKGKARLLVVGFASGTIPSLPINMALIKGFDVVGVRMGAQAMLEPDMYNDMKQELLKMANEGKLLPHVSAEYPMEKAKEAFTSMEERKVIGKCCIVFAKGAPSKL